MDISNITLNLKKQIIQWIFNFKNNTVALSFQLSCKLLARVTHTPIWTRVSQAGQKCKKLLFCLKLLAEAEIRDHGSDLSPPTWGRDQHVLRLDVSEKKGSR
jgi:hypothetical protein